MTEPNRHFTVIVAGEKPEEIMQKYDSNLKVEPYVAYEFKKAGQYHKEYVEFYQEAIRKFSKQPQLCELMKSMLDHYESITDVELYTEIIEGLEDNMDPDTGDVILTSNPNAQHDGCQLGGVFALPLIDQEGNEKYSLRKKDVDWDKIHLNNKEVYEVAWELCMEGRKPQTEEENTIYNNMKNRTHYFESYGTKENYVICNTAFWGYAFVDENKWTEIADGADQFSWVQNFFERFIMPLDENTKISVYECLRK